MVFFVSFTEVCASEQDLYDFLWLDPDKKVYVLQEKIHPREKKYYIEVGAGRTVNADFQKSNNYSGRVGYNFHEEWGVEALYINYQNQPNDAYRNLKQVNTSYPFIRRINESYGLLGTWTPFYGKINTFNKIIYFDWQFGAGVTRINGESNRATFAGRLPTNYYEKASYTAAAVKTALKVHLTKKVHLSFELLNQHYRAPDPVIPSKREFTTNSDAIISVGFSF